MDNNPVIFDITDELLERLKRAADNSIVCRYNDGVICDPAKPRVCRTCGWNPKVAEKRSIAIRFSMKCKGETECPKK